jgi:hypothetical protein
MTPPIQTNKRKRLFKINQENVLETDKQTKPKSAKTLTHSVGTTQKIKETDTTKPFGLKSNPITAPKHTKPAAAAAAASSRPKCGGWEEHPLLPADWSLRWTTRSVAAGQGRAGSTVRFRAPDGQTLVGFKSALLFIKAAKGSTYSGRDCRSYYLLFLRISRPPEGPGVCRALFQ